MKRHISRLTLIAVFLGAATAQAQSPYSQVPPQPSAAPSMPAGQAPSPYGQPLPPTSATPYSPNPYGNSSPYSPAPNTYQPPSNTAPYSPAPAGSPYNASPAPTVPSYTPAPATPASYDGPPPYTPAPYSPSPYGPPAYTPAPGAPTYTPAAYPSGPQYTPAPYTPGPYTPAPAGPPSYTPAPGPVEHIPIGALEGPKWIFAADALLLERSVGSNVPLGYTADTGVGPPALATDTLYSGDELFNYETGVRLQLGRRFTDDIAVDAVYWGLQQWSVGRSIYGDPFGETVGANSPWTQTDKYIGYFDNFLGYTYKSTANNFELNERIMLGQSDPYHSLAWLWGFRYFNLNDNFTLSGSDLYTGDYENINWKTQNELAGLQLGLQWTKGWDRFQLVTEGKAGLFANFYNQKGNNLNSSGVADGSPAGFVPFNVSHDGTDLSGLFELSILARYRLNDFLWLRLGYQGYCMTGLALGPRQLGGYSHGGTVALDGPSIGMEATW